MCVGNRATAGNASTHCITGQFLPPINETVSLGCVTEQVSVTLCLRTTEWCSWYCVTVLLKFGQDICY